MAQGTFIYYMRELMLRQTRVWKDIKEYSRRGNIRWCLEVKVSCFWAQVVQAVGSQCSNSEGLNGSTSPIIQRKLELDKVCMFVPLIMFEFMVYIFTLLTSLLSAHT